MISFRKKYSNLSKEAHLSGMGNYGKDFYDSVVVSAREPRESLDSVKVKCPSKLVCCLSKVGPIGLKGARFDAHRPKFNYMIKPVWALGEHRRPTGQPSLSRAQD